MRRPKVSHLAIAIAVLALPAACESENTDESGEPGASLGTPLSPTESLLRVSMALRGKRPSLEEIAKVQADPSAIVELVDEYMDDEGFGQAMRDLHNEALLVRAPAAIYPAGFAAVDGLAGMDVQRINVSVTEAPLRLVEHVITRDKPYTEIVTADYTLADGVVAQVWDLDYAGNGTSWEVSHFRDGRPAAGLLSDSMVFTRHATTFSDKNRGRANAISRALLCFDFIDRQVEIDATINLADPAEVANAIEKNETCAGCHQMLDPLAAYFGRYYPLFVPGQITEYPQTFYSPDLADLFTVKPSGYFGYPGGDVRHLGQMIAEDPRFSLCAAKRFYSYFHQRPLSEVPGNRASALQSVLTKNMNAKDLVRAIVLADDFLLSSANGADAPKTLLKVRPWQLEKSFADLTGFFWQEQMDLDLGYGNVGVVDMMQDSFLGLHVLAGGIDSVNVTLPTHTMTASTSIVLDVFAARAADYVVDTDFQFTTSRKLLTHVSETEKAESAIRDQLAELHLRLYGESVAPDSQAVTLAWELFSGALADANGDPKRAWKTTLQAMLEDARLVFY
jgi:hypothetical protein